MPEGPLNSKHISSFRLLWVENIVINFIISIICFHSRLVLIHVHCNILYMFALFAQFVYYHDYI